MKVIGTVRAPAHASFERYEVNTIINKHFLGSAECNKIVKGKIVAKKHKNMSKVEAAHKTIFPELSFFIEADVLEDGHFANIRVV